MSALPVLYSRIVALDSDIHRDKRLTQPEKPYAFAAGTHVLPALVAEFTLACRDLPILFIDEPNEVSPVFVVGLKNGENLMVDPDGSWAGSHIPAYLRRYPFIGGTTAASDQIVCVDENASSLRNFTGDRLFDEAGAPTEVLKRAIAFVSEYTDAAKLTGVFTAHLRSLGLFHTVNINVTTPTGEKAVFEGLSAVNEEKLNGLSDADMLELRRRGFLAPIYAHLISLANFTNLGSRNAKLATAGVPTPVSA